MCSWALNSVIEYYSRSGTPVFGCTMDLSKAFDFVDFCELFGKLRKKKVAPIFLRTLLYIYSNQYCDVRWNSSYSFRFPISNGVRQGAISSPLFFNLYVNTLILQLESIRIGFKIGNKYCGIMVYCDDIVLLSASRFGLQAMVSISEKWAKTHKMKFSTNIDVKKSKTKCIIFSKKKIDRTNIANIILNDTPLPFVENFKHLGMNVNWNNSFDIDCDNKRCKFIGKVHSLRQELYFTSPEVMFKLLNTYCTSYYGSNCWDLYSNNCERLYNAWNVACRIILRLDFKTHRYLIEPLSNCMHPKVMLSSRFVKFHDSLSMSKKPLLRLLCNFYKNDLRSVHGCNLYKIASACNVPIKDLNPIIVKQKMSYFKVPNNELWRIPFIKELLAIKANKYELNGFKFNEIDNMLVDLCTS